MNMQDLIDHFGSQSAIAKALGTSDQVVSAWKVKNRIPLGRQYEIQILTAGKLRADAAHATRPDTAAASA
jgi:hypothetical protein